MTEKTSLPMRSLAAILSAALLLTCPGTEAYAQIARMKVGNTGAHANGGIARVGGNLQNQGLSMRLAALDGASLALVPGLNTLPAAGIQGTARNLETPESFELNDAESIANREELAKKLDLQKLDVVKALQENSLENAVPQTSRFKSAAKRIGSGIKNIGKIFSFKGESPDLVGPKYNLTGNLKGGKDDASKKSSSGLSKNTQAADGSTEGDKKDDTVVPPVVPPSDNGGSDQNGGKGGKSWLGLGKVAVMLIISLVIMQIGVEAWGAALGPLVQQIYGDFTIVATVGIWASIAGIAGRLLAPLIVTRFGEKRSYLGASIMRLASVSVLCALLATGHMTLPLMIFFYSLNGMVGGVSTNALDKLAKRLMNGEQAKLEKFWTVENTVLEIIGFTAPILTGAVVVSMGFMPALIAYPVAFAIAIVIAALAMRKNLKSLDQATAQLQAKEDKRAPRASLWAGVKQAVWPVYAPVARWAIRNSRWLAPLGAGLALLGGLAMGASAYTFGALTLEYRSASTVIAAVLTALLAVAAGKLSLRLFRLGRRAPAEKDKWLEALAAATPKPGLLARMISGVRSVWNDAAARKSPMAWVKAVILVPLAGTVIGRYFSKMARGARHVWGKSERRVEPSAWGKYVVAYPFNGTAVGGFFQKIAHGARVVWKNPTLRYSFLAFTAYMIINPLLYGIIAPGYGNLVAGAGNEELMTAISGWLTGFYSLGGLLVGLWMMREQKLIKKGKPEGETLQDEPQGTRSFAKVGSAAKSALWIGAAALPVLVKTFGIPAVILVSGFLSYGIALGYSTWAGLFVLVGLGTAGVKAIMAASSWLDRKITPNAKAYFEARFKQEASETPAPKRAFKERFAGFKASLMALLGKRAAEAAGGPAKLVPYTPEEQAELLRRSMLRWMRWGTVGLAAIATMALPLPLIGGSLSIPALAFILFGVAQVAATIKLTSFFQAKTPSNENDEAAVLGFFRYASLAASTIGLLSLKYLFNATTGYTPFIVLALAMIPLAGIYLYLTNKLRKVTDPKNTDDSDHPAIKTVAGFIAGAFLAGMVGLTAMSGSWLMTLVAAAVLALSARGRWTGEKTLLAEQSRKGWDGWKTILKDSRLAHFALGVLSVLLFGLLG